MKHNDNLSARSAIFQRSGLSGLCPVFQHVVRSFSVAVLLLATLTGCKDYITEKEPGAAMLNTFFTSVEAANQDIIGCYVPLMWEYNGTYCAEWFIGDIASDDALKGGGSTGDMADAYDFENWKTESTNALLLCIYRGNYQGIGRCNLALKYLAEMDVNKVKDFDQATKDRLMGEAYFLRAYYYFRLVRIFGGVPLTTTVIDNSSDWACPRSSAKVIYGQILADLDSAQNKLWTVNDVPVEQLGRATKGAAQAMLMKVHLYLASPYWASARQDGVDHAAQAKAWGDKLIASGDYTLCTNYWENFSLAGENGPESVFEIQYKEVPWGDYGEGFGYTAGSFTQILTRSRSSLIGGGWGFNHPTQNLYDEFEEHDARRNLTILVPEQEQMENMAEEYYLGNKNLSFKYGMYLEETSTGGGYGKWGIHATRGPLNNKQIRYADVLLMHAEACLLTGNDGEAINDINQVRERALMPAVGTDYTFYVNGEKHTSTQDLTVTLRHERRMELAMEGHRWFDLVRWGNTKAHMEAYQKQETPEAQAHLATFIEGKHELFPIPSEEIILNDGLNASDQNPGY